MKNIIVVLALFVYTVLGVYSYQLLLEGSHLPDSLLEDFSYYARAFDDARQGNDPYAGRDIGTGFLYPPPSLLLVGAFASIEPAYVRNAIYIAFNLAMLGLILWGVARYSGYSLDRVWWWFPLAFAFAPVLELFHIGQINLFTLLGIFLVLVFAGTLPALAGFGLMLAAMTKVTPLAFLGVLVVGRHWRALAWSVAWLIISILAAALVFGWQPLLTYPDAFSWLPRWFLGGSNAQSLVVMLNTLGWMPASQFSVVQTALQVYVFALFAVSGWLALRAREREPFFIVLCLGIMVLPNIMWYHHYVFFILPFVVWMAWSKLNRYVIAWCALGMTIVQLDHLQVTHGIVAHLVAHVSILAIVGWQVRNRIQKSKASSQ